MQAGHPDAAFLIIERSTRYTPEYRFDLAFNAKIYDSAFAIASVEYEKNKGIYNSFVKKFLTLYRR